jgi:hypothetical protein
MQDFKNSVAHLDVDVSVAVSVSAVVGDNFYKFLYVSNETIDALTSVKSPILLTADTYVDVIDALIADSTGITEEKAALMKKNIASLFSYAPSREGYLISYQDYAKFKYYGYLAYLEAEYTYTEASGSDPATLTPDTKTQALLTALNSVWDKAFSQAFIDIPVVASAAANNAVPDAVVDELLESLNSLTFDLGVFARGAADDYAWAGTSGSGTLAVGFSPALYQLGRTLSVINVSGTPIANSMDTVACTFQDVLPTRNTSAKEIVNASAMFINWAQNSRVQYFKTVGNGTGNISLYGGWTLKGMAEAADWIVAYTNFMTKVDCAQIITVMNTYKSEETYGKCLAAMADNIAPFIQLGRIANYKVTAPAYADLPKTDGHTITIPDAWTGLYQDNVRKVNIQGSLTVEA